eukprot:jgi/Botrbrau1/9915/Bobra.0012s0015.2
MGREGSDEGMAVLATPLLDDRLQESTSPLSSDRGKHDFPEGLPKLKPDMARCEDDAEGDPEDVEDVVRYDPPTPAILTAATVLTSSSLPDFGTLPMFPIDCAPIPGQLLPLAIHGVRERAVFRRHLYGSDSGIDREEPSPWAGYIAVRDRSALPSLGVVARVVRCSRKGHLALIEGVCKCSFRDVFLDVALARMACTVIASRWHNDEVGTIQPGWDDAMDAARDSVIDVFETTLPMVQCIRGDPENVSQWLAAQAPMSFASRLHLGETILDPSKFSTPLGKVQSILQRLDWFSCRRCDMEVAHTDKVVQVVDQGPLVVCCNPHGFVHSFICFLEVSDSVEVSEPACSDSSWFPGYAWQPVECRCRTHLGWKFTAVQAGLSLRHFWGLKDASISDGAVFPNHWEDDDGGSQFGYESGMDEHEWETDDPDNDDDGWMSDEDPYF